jgi:hypothetical protein
VHLFWFPSSAWEPKAWKLCFPIPSDAPDKQRLLDCIPKRSLKARIMKQLAAKEARASKT